MVNIAHVIWTNEDYIIFTRKALKRMEQPILKGTYALCLFILFSCIKIHPLWRAIKVTMYLNLYPLKLQSI